MGDTYTMTIAGEGVAGAESYGVINPATADSFAEAPNCTANELEQAIAAAQAAGPAWRKTTIDERRGVMNAMAGKIAENAETLARLLTKEQGKPFE
ncbi:MAG: aldehyde dehydrogenase family protein, partial [Pseudomonadota bacterium]